MDDNESSGPGTPEHQMSPVKSDGDSFRPSTPEPLNLGLYFQSSHTKNEPSPPERPKISRANAKRCRRRLFFTPEKLTPTSVTKVNSNRRSPMEESPTKRSSQSPEHSPKKRPCTREISMDLMDLPGPSSAPYGYFRMIATKTLPYGGFKLVAEELYRQVPEELPEEPTPDPATAEIIPNKETVIEITLNDKPLGIDIVGGCDTFIKGPAAVILEVYKQGAAGQDGRLKVGDQIRKCNGMVIHENIGNQMIDILINRNEKKISMTVYRPDPLQFEVIETEIEKQPGKTLRINCRDQVRGPGFYINELKGSAAESNGLQLQKGDFLVQIGNTDVTDLSYRQAAAMADTVFKSEKTTFKVKRFKIIPREIPSVKMPNKLTF